MKQRNALLRAGIRNAEDRTTRDVLDDAARRVGRRADRRAPRADRAARHPRSRDAYASLAGDAPGFATSYEAEWSERRAGRAATVDAAMADALRAALRGARRTAASRSSARTATTGRSCSTASTRGITRRRASNARSRSGCGSRAIAWSPTSSGAEPLLLLDDVFSELDAHRAAALVAHLPATQTLVTTAGALPEGIAAAAWLRIENGRSSAVRVVTRRGAAPVGDALRAVRRQLGTPAPSVFERVRAAWPEVVGDALAAPQRAAAPAGGGAAGRRGRPGVGRASSGTSPTPS